MKKIDKFLEMMVQRKVERAVLTSGKPYQIWVEGRKTEGAVLPFEQLREVLLEIAPQSQHAQVIQGGAFHFCHQSNYGTFDIGSEIFFDSIQLAISPAKSTSVIQSVIPAAQTLPPPIPPVTPQVAVSSPSPSQIYCQRCGTPANTDAIVCLSCGVGLGSIRTVGTNQGSNRVAAGICGILFGWTGIHKFILGYSTEGIVMLLLSLFGSWWTFGITWVVIGTIGFIEGIIYITKSDAEFYDRYVVNKRGWF